METSTCREGLESGEQQGPGGVVGSGEEQGLLLQDQEPGLYGVTSHPLISLRSDFMEGSLIPHTQRMTQLHHRVL